MSQKAINNNASGNTVDELVTVIKNVTTFDQNNSNFDAEIASEGINKAFDSDKYAPVILVAIAIAFVSLLLYFGVIG